VSEERLSMSKIREVLRLHHEAGLSNQAIARVCKVSHSTVGEYLIRAAQAGLEWPLPEGLSEDDLQRCLFPEKGQAAGAERPMLDWEEIHRDLSKRGVIMILFWQEYRKKHPDGYGYTQFREYYQRWNQAHASTMCLPYKGGEAMEADYAGMIVPITNPETGEIPRRMFLCPPCLPAVTPTWRSGPARSSASGWVGTCAFLPYLVACQRSCARITSSRM